MKNHTMLSKIWLAFIRIAFLYLSAAIGVLAGSFMPLLLLEYIYPLAQWSLSGFEFSKLAMLFMIPSFLALAIFIAWKGKTALREIFVESNKFPIPLFRHLIIICLLVALIIATLRLSLQLLYYMSIA